LPQEQADSGAVRNTGRASKAKIKNPCLPAGRRALFKTNAKNLYIILTPHRAENFVFYNAQGKTKL